MPNWLCRVAELPARLVGLENCGQIRFRWGVTDDDHSVFPALHLLLSTLLGAGSEPVFPCKVLPIDDIGVGKFRGPGVKVLIATAAHLGRADCSLG